MTGKTRNSKLLNKVANVDKTSTQRTRKQKLIKMTELMVKEHNASFIIFMHFPNNHESVINVQKLGDFAIAVLKKPCMKLARDEFKAAAVQFQLNRKSGTDKEEEISVLGHHTPNVPDPSINMDSVVATGSVQSHQTSVVAVLLAELHLVILVYLFQISQFRAQFNIIQLMYH